MKRFVEGVDRGQSALFPECLDDWIDENNPVRVIDAFVDTLDLAELGFEGAEPAETGRPAYHPSVEFDPISDLRFVGRARICAPLGTGRCTWT